MNIKLTEKMTYKSWVTAGTVLLGLGLGTVAHAETINNTSQNNVTVASTNSATVSTSSAVVESVSTSSSAESATAVSQVTATSATSATATQSGSVASVVSSVSSSAAVTSSSITSASNASSAVASESVATTNLGDASSEQVESAKSAAAVAYKATGVAQKITAVSATAVKAKNGWVTDPNTQTKYFYQNGQKATGYLNDGSHWYMFKDGLKQSDVQKWAGTYYYFDHKTYLRVDNAYLRSNWGDYYLFGSNGRILTDVQKWAGTYYYFDHNTYLRVDNNYLKSNWGDWYMFGNNGQIVTGLKLWYGAYYYFKANTYLKAANATVNIAGKNYKFNQSGKLVSNTVNATGTTYYADANGNVSNRDKLISQLVSVVKAQLGKPYVYGAAGPNAFDCSGLVQYAYKQIGITLPRTTTGQQNVGTAISLSSVQVGDLLFWGNYGSPYHVAIYVGNGQVIMAPKTNTVIRAEAMSDWMPTFARRIL